MSMAIAMEQPWQLPYELYAMILQFCDTPNLKTASLVNRTFHELSLIYLFRCVLLRDNAYVPDVDDTLEYLTAQKFHSLIEAHPKIAEYVRSLSIDISRNWLAFHVNCWVTEDTILQGLLPRLKQLNEISIYGQPTIQWRDLPDKLRNALQTAVQLPLLHTLGIGGIVGFPLRSISGSPSIKHFSHSSNLRMLDGYEHGDATSTHPLQNPIDLQSMTLLEMSKVDVHVLKAVFVLNHLVEFNFSLVTFDCLSQFALVIRTCAESLETLGIRVDKLPVTPITFPLVGSPQATLQYREDFPIMDLSRLPKLRKLKFSTYIEGDFAFSPEICYICRIPWIISCLKTLPSSPSKTLSEIVIDATPLILSDTIPPSDFCFEYPWKDLVDAFFTPNLADVKSFSLNFNTVTTRHYHDTFMATLKSDAQLGRLRERDLLTIGTFSK